MVGDHTRWLDSSGSFSDPRSITAAATE
jgi:hypothetical protein